MSKNVERFLDVIIAIGSMVYATLNLINAIDLLPQHNFGYNFIMSVAGTLLGYMCCILFIKEV